MNIFNEFEKLKEHFLHKNVLIAVSGGVDSLCLMISFNEWIKNNKFDINLTAITVDHKLRPTSADETLFVNKLCKKLNIKHVIKTWDGEKPISNLELIAREKRYELIKEEYLNGENSCLLTAHHIDDQAENFFIRLFRGSGIDGLSSMNQESELYNMKIIRPFLNLHKDDLIQYLQEKNIKWVEDESNNDEKYLRNKIRNFLNSFEDKNLITERIGFAINEISKSKNFINEEFLKYKNKFLKFNSFGSCILNFEKLKNINIDIALRIICFASMKISGNIYKPRFEKLKRLFENIKTNADFKYTFYGCVFEKINDNLLMVYREYNAIDEDKELKYNQEVVWDNRFLIKLLVDESDFKITHVKDGEFNKILQEIRKENFAKFKELKEIKGMQKNIFYTLPVLCKNDKYFLYSEAISITCL